MEAFTARTAVKYVAKAAVQLKAAQLAKTTMTDYTSLDEDGMTVKISSYLIGWYVSDKMKPLTDRMVDTTADFIAVMRAARAAKKTTEEK